MSSVNVSASQLRNGCNRQRCGREGGGGGVQGQLIHTAERSESVGDAWRLVPTQQDAAVYLQISGVFKINV